MKLFLALVFSLVLIFCGCGTESTPVPKETPTPPVTERISPTIQEISTSTAKEMLPKSQQAAAIAEIKKLGGRVTLNKSGDVIEVRLDGFNITDAALEHLKGLTSLNTLDLHHTKITDAGLEQLKGLTSLKDLNLMGTKITIFQAEHK